MKLKKSCGSIIYLAGDSSLDNKHWFHNRAAALNGYDLILDPPESVKDIAYWINYEIVKRGLQEEFTAINGAIEESTIRGRACGKLKDQDVFIRDNIEPKDYLVLSVGGNDIALQPSPCTICNTIALLSCTNTECLKNCTCGCALPCDEYFMGMGPSCFSNCLAFPCGYGYFLHLFGTRVNAIARRMISGKNKPKKVLICMIYYLDEKPGNSWAEGALSLLGYNRDPSHLQMLIRKVYEQATKAIVIDGTEVVAVPLFAGLDGKHTEDYSQRVEPSASGGQKLAVLILDGVLRGRTAMDERLRAADMQR